MNIKRILLLLVVLLSAFCNTNAVLKEKNLEQTLSVLREELVIRHKEQTDKSIERRRYNTQTLNELMEVIKSSSQNSLMLYSQNQEYVFDLTYACHEATELYQQFQSKQEPFKQFLLSHDAEIAKFDSLIVSLNNMPLAMLGS